MNNTPSPFDYTMWRALAWCGPIFIGAFLFFFGILGHNLPPVGADLTPQQLTQHYIDNGMSIRIGMSVCIVFATFYIPWGVAVSRLMRRIEGGEGMLGNLQMLGAAISSVIIIVPCGLWLMCSIEAPTIQPETIHLLYWMGWMIIDLGYMAFTFQIAAEAIVFLRDPRGKPLVAPWVCWAGFVTCAAFFMENLIPFFKTGPFAFHGLFNFWVAYGTWFVWVIGLSYYVITAITRLQQEDGALSVAPKAASTGFLGAREAVR